MRSRYRGLRFGQVFPQQQRGNRVGTGRICSLIETVLFNIRQCIENRIAFCQSGIPDIVPLQQGQAKPEKQQAGSHRNSHFPDIRPFFPLPNSVLPILPFIKFSHGNSPVSGIVCIRFPLPLQVPRCNHPCPRSRLVSSRIRGFHLARYRQQTRLIGETGIGQRLQLQAFTLLAPSLLQSHELLA